MAGPGENSDGEQRPRPPTLLQTAASVLAAFFGVQSRANRERDFTRGRPLHFILLGLVFTILFIGGVMLAVKFTLSQAG